MLRISCGRESPSRAAAPRATVTCFPPAAHEERPRWHPRARRSRRTTPLPAFDNRFAMSSSTIVCGPRPRSVRPSHEHGQRPELCTGVARRQSHVGVRGASSRRCHTGHDDFASASRPLQLGRLRRARGVEQRQARAPRRPDLRDGARDARACRARGVRRRFLFGQLRGGRCRAYDADLRVCVLATGLATYPDVTVVCGPRARGRGLDARRRRRLDEHGGARR